jgi:hypothetical protein
MKVRYTTARAVSTCIILASVVLLAGSRAFAVSQHLLLSAPGFATASMVEGADKAEWGGCEYDDHYDHCVDEGEH